MIASFNLFGAMWLANHPLDPLSTLKDRHSKKSYLSSINCTHSPRLERKNPELRPLYLSRAYASSYKNDSDIVIRFHKVNAKL